MVVAAVAILSLSGNFKDGSPKLLRMTEKTPQSCTASLAVAIPLIEED